MMANDTCQEKFTIWNHTQTQKFRMVCPFRKLIMLSESHKIYFYRLNIKITYMWIPILTLSVSLLLPCEYIYRRVQWNVRACVDFCVCEYVSSSQMWWKFKQNMTHISHYRITRRHVAMCDILSEYKLRLGRRKKL